METVSWFFNVVVIGGFGAGIGTALGIIVGERQSRREIRDQMTDERHVLKDALQQISQTHNALTLTQKDIDMRLGDVELKVGMMFQGTKK
jgi:hypothetical protein